MNSRIILLLVVFCWNSSIAISQQEKIFSLAPLMGTCDSSIVMDYNVEELSVIYYNTKDTSLTITYCFANSWCTGFKIHDSNGNIRFYFGSPKDEDYSSPFLHRAEWIGNQLKFYEILGPGSFYQSFNRDENGDMRIIDRTEESGGYILEMDSTHRTKAKGIYDIEPATLTWLHYYKNGLLKEKYTHYWPRGKLKVGPYLKFDENGDLLIKGQYLTYDEIKEFGLEEEEGIKDGVWYEYMNGEIVKEEIWVKGKPQ